MPKNSRALLQQPLIFIEQLKKQVSIQRAFVVESTIERGNLVEQVQIKVEQGFILVQPNSGRGRFFFAVQQQALALPRQTPQRFRQLHPPDTLFTQARDKIGQPVANPRQPPRQIMAQQTIRLAMIDGPIAEKFGNMPADELDLALAISFHGKVLGKKCFFIT